MSARTYPVQIFLGSLVVLLVVFIFVFLNGNYGFLKKENCYRVFAKFNNVSGLSVGSKVKISGLSVGKVESFTLDASAQKVATALCINVGINIPADTVAAIAFENFFSGAKFINLEFGTEEDFLKNGDQFLITHSSVDLESLIKQFVMK